MFDNLYLRILSILLIFIVIAVGTLYFFQEKLLFFPRQTPLQNLTAIKKLDGKVEEMSLHMDDGTKLNGWLLKNNTAKPAKTIIYFGGNAEELSGSLFSLQNISGWSVALINYRGYGSSEGSPNQVRLLSDALEIYKHFAQRPDVDPEKIVIMGRSIGTGVAVHVAAHTRTAGAILVSPYDSITGVAKETYPAFLVDALLRNPFDSLKLAPAIKTPTLILIAENDVVVAPWRSHKLAQHWGGKVTVREIPLAGHNSIAQNVLYWQAINNFLQEI